MRLPKVTLWFLLGVITSFVSSSALALTLLKLEESFQVVGVIADGDPKSNRVGIAVLKDLRNGGKSLVVREGGAIPGYPSLKVKAIARKKVTVTDGRQQQTLSYQAFQASPSVDVAVARSTKAGSTSATSVRDLGDADEEFGDNAMSESDVDGDWNEPFDEFPEDMPPPYNQEKLHDRGTQSEHDVDSASRAWIPSTKDRFRKKARNALKKPNTGVEPNPDEWVDAVPHPDDL